MKACLIVDDSAVIRMVGRKILEDLGFETGDCADFDSALSRCRERMPDAVLIEWEVKGRNGADFIRALRALPGGGRPAVLFCTGRTTREDIEAALAAGAVEYIMKPFDSGVIEAKFQRAGLIGAGG
jgi:two-component system chemotaxis response regulator CheY